MFSRLTRKKMVFVAVVSSYTHSWLYAIFLENGFIHYSETCTAIAVTSGLMSVILTANILMTDD